MCLCVCGWWGWDRETIKTDRYGNFCAVVGDLWPRTSQKIFFCSVTREKSRATQTVLWLWSVWQSVNSCRKRVCMCVQAAWVCPWVCVLWGQPVAALRSGAWSSVLWGRGACPWQAAVISGAQRAEFIRLSQGHEPFQPATLQFVSHFASYNGTYAACVCTFSICTIVSPRASLNIPRMARCIWTDEWWGVRKLHVCTTKLFTRGSHNAVNTIKLLLTLVNVWFSFKFMLRSRLVCEIRLLWRSVSSSKDVSIKCSKEQLINWFVDRKKHIRLAVNHFFQPLSIYSIHFEMNVRS